MDKSFLNGNSEKLFLEMNSLSESLDEAYSRSLNRSLPFTEEIFDRWKRAEKLGFGKGSSIFDNSFVFGKVDVGENVWIGPYTIMDGSGGLTIGCYSTISAGVHIYSHDNIGATLTAHQASIEREPVSIGNCTYIGPNVIIQKGVSIGNQCIIGANAFVAKSVASNSIAVGSPAKVIGKTIVEDDKIRMEYFQER